MNPVDPGDPARDARAPAQTPEVPIAGAHENIAPRRTSVDLFPLVWTGFLLASTAFTVMRAGPPVGLPIAAARTPARDLLGVIALGVVLLWPMLRLSRQRAATPGGAVSAGGAIVADSFVVAAPAIAVVLAMQALIGWGWAPTLAIVALFLVWTIAIGGALACAARARASSPAARSLVMLAIVGGALGAPALLWLVAPSPVDRALALLSPVTGVYALTASGDGAPLAVRVSDWLILALPLVPGAALWAFSHGNPTGGRLDSGEGATRPAGPHQAPRATPNTRDAGTPESAAFFSPASDPAEPPGGARSDQRGPSDGIPDPRRT